MKRHSRNPLISRADIPRISPHLDDVSSVFNPGAVRWGDQIVLFLRVQNRGRETFLLPAFSRDGVNFNISTEPVRFLGIGRLPYRIYHIYDPRITRLGDTYYITVAIDMDDGCRIGLARTTDFREFEFMAEMLPEDARNAVIFPEKIDGMYIVLYRPNRSSLDGVSSGSEIRIAVSPDLVKWTPHETVMSGRFHYWDEFIGSGPPPLKTSKGWLHVYHGVATHFGASNIYQAGAVLLDLNHPERVIARSRYNILEPREPYELAGQVPNVVFPSGLIPSQPPRGDTLDDDAELFLYYGAADTCIGLATTTVRELLEACE
ncbi:MAG TPA: glycoside hydrolase family 130 protein [Candidatus Acidoferrum sp.]|nr:glycoside hydrolase family 130 protein [Candidatus Acidoferrum sp.]